MADAAELETPTRRRVPTATSPAQVPQHRHLTDWRCQRSGATMTIAATRRTDGEPIIATGVEVIVNGIALDTRGGEWALINAA